MGKEISENRIDTVLRYYVAAALWSSTNPDNEDEEFLDENYSIEDIDDKLLTSMKSDIKKFISENYDSIEESGMNDEQLGHDLWLTRNGHGAGFWDRGYEKEISDKLSDSARDMKGTDLYVGDDGKIYALQVYAKGGGLGNSFSNDTDEWFDFVADNSGAEKFQSNEMFLKAIEITNKEATNVNLGKLRELILATPFSKKVKDSLDNQIKKIIDGKYKGEFKFSFGGRRSGGGRTSAASEFFSMFNQAATYNFENYSKGGGVGKGKIKFFEVADRIKHLQYDQDPTDLRLHCEESFRWGAKEEKDYKAAEKEIDNIHYKGKGWEIYGWYDVSGFDYWMKRQEETNYIQLTVAFDKDTVDESEVEKIDKALDSALADADAIEFKYSYDPYNDEDEMKRGGKVKNRKWIQDALSGGKNKGALRRTAMRKGLLRSEKEKLSKTDLDKLEKMGGKTAKRAYLAETLKKFGKGGEFGDWEGTDADLEISLEEYGFVARHTTKDYPDEYHIVYKLGDNSYGYSFVREKFLNDLINGEEWASEDNVKSFLSFVGLSKEEWLSSAFVHKLSDTIQYWGQDNVLGTEYHPNDKKWAYEFIGIEDSGDYAKGGGVGDSVSVFEKKIKDLLKQENKWHFVSEEVDGKKVAMKFFVGKKEVDVQIFTIDNMVARMPRNYSGKRDTLKMIMDNFKKMSSGGSVDKSYTLSTYIKFKTSGEDSYLKGNIGGDRLDLIDVQYLGDNTYDAVIKSYDIRFTGLNPIEFEDEIFNALNEEFGRNDLIEVDLISVDLSDEYSSGGGVSNSRPEHYRYLTIQKVKGGLQVSLNEDGVELVKELKEEGQSDWDIWSELFESVQGNSEYIFHLDMGDSGFGLTSAEGITDGYHYEGEDRSNLYKTDYPESAKVYWFPNYMIQSPLDIMIEKGSVVFDEAQSNESEMKNGGGVNSDCGCVHSDVYNSIMDCLNKGNEVSVEALTLYLDRKPNYEEEIGGFTLRKCYLRPYYKTK